MYGLLLISPEVVVRRRRMLMMMMVDSARWDGWITGCCICAG